MPAKRRLSGDDSQTVAANPQPERPATPVNLTVPTQAPKATPKSMGSGSFTASGGFTSSKIEKVTPWITRDVEHHATCDFDTFLRFALRKVDQDAQGDLPADAATPVRENARLENTLKAMLPVCNDPDVHQGLNKYCAKVKREPERYAPFVKTFNAALTELKSVQVDGFRFRPHSKLDILFCRNAEKEIEGKHQGGFGRYDVITKRKPDILLTTFSAAEQVLGMWPRPKILRLATLQPPGNFHWSHGLLPCELKIYDRKLPCPKPFKDTSLKARYQTLDVHSKRPTPLAVDEKGTDTAPAPRLPKRQKTAAEAQGT